MISYVKRCFTEARSYIRNFCIVAHIDHGKSTLADRFLELTGTKVDKAQVLDKLAVERERGITVRAQTATMNYEYKGHQYLLNLIDTPGHVDFSYEVSRSLRACQGAILLVDATAGIQAQTFSTFYQAFEANLEIIPGVNKIDHPSAVPELVVEQLKTHFDLHNPFMVSAKTGQGVKELIEAVIEKVPPPPGNTDGRLRCFLFDSWYDWLNGVICAIEIVDGRLQKGDRIRSINNGKTYQVHEIGFMRLELEPRNSLESGQVGYVVLNMKETSEALIGDTFCMVDDKDIVPFEGFKKSKCMVFSGVFPIDQEECEDLNKALMKYNLEDRSLVIQKDQSAALGNGFRCGFLGLLHMDIFKERLDREHKISVIMTPPSVPYKAILKDGTEILIEKCNEMPDKFKIKTFLEPMVSITIVIPNEYLGDVMSFCLQHRSKQDEIVNIDTKHVLLRYSLPLSEIIVDFYDCLKSITKGMATMDYEHKDYREADLGKLVAMINSDPIDALTFLVHRSQAYDKAKILVEKLKENIPGQQFDISIQASFDGKVIASQKIRPFRKDVLAKLYGGDQTRKNKLLDKQKRGKKKMKMIGNVEVDPATFQNILRN
ncbi:unnamed protein product [Blepharisma stoltei]|uniref:Translation factor GUF1 homolog, mitochondrial n=1 Tax=Blepharisma stoltei TaxID=1481888 RepID=A0AAU9J740_9CILI|nr:unnamed protein product [Blepharisma stoltei]